MKFSSFIIAIGLMALASSGALAAPILTITGEKPDAVVCDNGGQGFPVLPESETSSERQYDLGRCADSITQVEVVYSSGIQVQNGTPACVLSQPDFNNNFSITIDEDCTVNVTLIEESTVLETGPAPAPTEPPKPVPTLPLYALFVMAGLLSVVGLRQLMK